MEGFETPPSPRYSFSDPITANMGGPVTFEAPELPEETLMEVRSSFLTQKIPCVLMLVFLSDQSLCRVTFLLTLASKLPPSSSLSASVGVQQEHTETVQSLRFTLDFTYCLMEVAGARGAVVAGRQGDVSHLSLLQQQSLVADQISSLSREWR